MKVVQNLADWKALRPTLSGSVGLIPTMGFLHEGHMSLVRRSKAENGITICWIFVNPAQFSPTEDFASYPRDTERDLALLEAAGVDYVLMPSVEDVYPPGFQTYVNVEELAGKLEGAHRPGHFRGVATVVCKMLCLTQPQHAYFGQKDGQQCIVVTRMAAELGLLCEIVVCPTIREADGLALSSRNVRLTPEQRQGAPVVYRALQAAGAAIAAGERSAEVVRTHMQQLLAGEPLGQPEYVSVAEPETLEECGQITGRVMVSLAVRFGAVRLIDNLMVTP